jgi:hypothetical protein
MCSKFWKDSPFFLVRLQVYCLFEVHVEHSLESGIWKKDVLF